MTNTAASNDGVPSRRSALIRIALLAALLVVLVVVAREAGGYIPRFAQWIDGLGFWGPLVFMVGYAVATVAFVPGSLLTMAGGAVFGLRFGTAYVFVGASVGATAAFLIARYFARSAIERKLAGNARFTAIDRAVGEQGRRIVFLLRLSPVFPFILLNYGLGLTKVRLLDYVVACLGMLPGTLLYTYYGKVVGDVAALAAGTAPERGGAQWTLLGVGLLATVVVTTLVTRIAARALEEATDD